MKMRLQKQLMLGLLAVSCAIALSACKKGDSDEGEENEQIVTENMSIEISELGNPITGFDASGKQIYHGDPAAMVDGDTVYLYGGHDVCQVENYQIPEWLCYSSKDMVHWTYESVILKCSDIGWADNNSAWAAQCIKHFDKTSNKDKYYFYFCSADSTANGKKSIGVAVSDSPKGPFVDIGHSLVKGTFTTDESNGWNDIDPTVWVETGDDGVEHRYLCWGNEKTYICELNEDMISVKDIDGDGKIVFTKDVISKKTPEKFTEAPWIYRQKDASGKYYGPYYLFYAYGWREQMAYATTNDLMNEDWKFGSVIMEPTATSNTNHMAVIDFKGKTYFIYHNGSLSKGSGYRRVACVEEFKINEDGTIDYIKETATGISGFTSTIKGFDGNLVVHENWKNSTDDGKYPYVTKNMGTTLKNTTEDDSKWQIVPGRSKQTTEGCYVSIEAYNKPGLFWTVANNNIKLSADYTGLMKATQTFKVLKGLNGNGITLESTKYPGKYVTLTNGYLKLTDGIDKDNCSFTIENQK